MQLYIATYFVCKIFIVEGVTLRTSHKMLRTLHSVNIRISKYAFILLTTGITLVNKSF